VPLSRLSCLIPPFSIDPIFGAPWLSFFYYSSLAPDPVWSYFSTPRAIAFPASFQDRSSCDICSNFFHGVPSESKFYALFPPSFRITIFPAVLTPTPSLALFPIWRYHLISRPFFPPLFSSLALHLFLTCKFCFLFSKTIMRPFGTLTLLFPLTLMLDLTFEAF